MGRRNKNLQHVLVTSKRLVPFVLHIQTNKMPPRKVVSVGQKINSNDQNGVVAKITHVLCDGGYNVTVIGEMEVNE